MSFESDLGPVLDAFRAGQLDRGETMLNIERLLIDHLGLGMYKIYSRQMLVDFTEPDTQWNADNGIDLADPGSL